MESNWSPNELQRRTELIARNIKKETGDLYGVDPKIMMILGTGCDGVAARIEPIYTFSCNEFMGMPYSTAPDHKGEIIIGKYDLGEDADGNPVTKDVIAFSGRIHYYEGWSAHETSFLVYLGKQLGAKMSLMTSAVGIAPDPAEDSESEHLYPADVGDILLVESTYPNFQPSALRGQISERVGPRFCGTMNVPDIYLSLVARAVAEKEEIELGSCGYWPREGPDYETPLEVSMLSLAYDTTELPIVGGMSLVNELSAANMLGMASLAFAVVTNQMFDLADKENIVNAAQFQLGQILDESGYAKHTLDEARNVVSEIIRPKEPHHEDVKEEGSSGEVTENLDSIIRGVVRAVRV